MKKFFVCFIGALLMAQNSASGAITVKKASSVAKKETKVQDVGGSLLPTAIGLYSTIKQLNQQQQELSAECEPTGQELSWVNNMIKEWAKSGGRPSDLNNVAGMKPCDSQSSYKVSVKNNVNDGTDICYDSFKDASDAKTVWHKYPKASSVSYCVVDGEYSTSCTKVKSKKTASNIYEVFSLIDFSTEDYTADEAAMASKLLAKMEKCAPARLNARKAALWGDFVMTTVGSVGQKTNTGSIMDAVSGIAASGGGFGGALQSLSGIATQLIDK